MSIPRRKLTKSFRKLTGRLRKLGENFTPQGLKNLNSKIMEDNELTNVNIALYALATLNGTTKKVATETIAIKCFELSPSRFSWRLYPQYPDIEAARIALFDAQKEKNGSLVSGRYGKTTGTKLGDGWIFTPKGIAWMETSQPRIVEQLNKPAKPLKRTERDKRLLEVQKSVAFRKYLKDGNCQNIKVYEFTDCLEASLDTPPHLLRDQIEKIKALAAGAKREQILNFLSECETVFNKTLGN